MSTNEPSTLPGCSKCGANVRPGDRFCRYCGVALPVSSTAQPYETEPGNVPPSQTRKSTPQEHEFVKKGSRLLGTEIYVPVQESQQEQHEVAKESLQHTIHTSEIRSILMGVAAAIVFIMVVIYYNGRRRGDDTGVAESPKATEHEHEKSKAQAVVRQIAPKSAEALGRSFRSSQAEVVCRYERPSGLR